MKKYLLATLLTFSIFSTSSEAKDGAYIGADLLHAKVSHTFQVPNSDRFALLGYKSGATSRDTSTGFSLSAGYRFDLPQSFFLAPEVFYDHINSKATDFFANEDPSAAQDHMDIDSRFGGKLNLGYDITSKFSAFVNAGLADVKYGMRWPSQGRSRAVYKIAAIYGLGASYKVTDSIAIRASYDRQQFAAQYINEGRRDSIKLQTLKIGAVYSF